jgi:ATP-dependent helicase HrpA
MVIAPTRAACETIELALQVDVATLLRSQHGDELRRWAVEGKSFGIVAGTGTGKTLSIRFIAEAILRADLRVGVVNREREATPETAACNVVVVTTGIARRWLTDGLVNKQDTIVVDEIHQTSAELELCLALGKRNNCRFIWLSATVDPTIYREYLNADEVLVTSAFDPKLRAKVEVTARKPDQFLDDKRVRRMISQKRGVAVFLPTRAEVERLGKDLGSRFPQLETAFYHGGEPIRVIRPFLEGEAKKPYLLAMTAAGQSALNLPGLDTVVIYDARYGNVVSRGRNVLHRLHLGPNEILQMAGRVHGRVPGGEVFILSDRQLDFDTLSPGPPEFQLAGDAERVALTCAGLGVDARELELPVPLDRHAYVRAVEKLTARGVVEDGRLTDYGKQIESLPLDRPWAELLLQSTDSILPLVAGASSIDSLHRMTRDERDLRGVLVPGSDHLTAYNLLAEAVNECGRLGKVHGLVRYQFDEQGLEDWANRRGVLMKAIEGAALGMAAAYRALDTELPSTLPQVDRKRNAEFIQLLAEFQPFDLVLDEQTVDGQDARVSRTSVAGSWGAVAGRLRYFADRQGVARASIEGTTIPYELVRKFAARSAPEVVLTGHGSKQGFGLAHGLHYFGFSLDTTVDRVDGTLAVEHRDQARQLLAESLLSGVVDHRSRGKIVRAAKQLAEYWRRSGGVLQAASEEAILELLVAQLGDCSSWQDFLKQPLDLDVEAILPAGERRHLDALPTSVRIYGDMVPLEYVVGNEGGEVRLMLRMGQARRITKEDLPRVDRPLLLAVRRRGEVVEAPTVERLQELVKDDGARPRRDNKSRGGAAGKPRHSRDSSPRAGHGRPGKGQGRGRGGSRRRGR